jgi:hypothetical protein
MSFQRIWISDHGRSKEGCLFAKNWVIITDHSLCENFMCCTTSATPTASEIISSGLLKE